MVERRADSTSVSPEDRVSHYWHRRIEQGSSWACLFSRRIYRSFACSLILISEKLLFLSVLIGILAWQSRPNCVRLCIWPTEGCPGSTGKRI